MIAIMCGIMVIVIVTSPVLVHTACNLESERVELVRFFESCNGDQWVNRYGWNTSLDLDAWAGITCKNGRVWLIELPRNGIAGFLPPQPFEALTSLERVFLEENSLIGPIPAMKLPRLTELHLPQNQLSGSLPSLDGLPSLKGLDLASNQFSGVLPSFERLVNIARIRLTDNRLVGQLPSFDFNPKLTELYLGSNEFTGNVPSFTNNQLLFAVSLDSNSLTGSMPSFQLPKCRLLTLASNQLNSTIPP
jgi:Leucine-rich repeat (LRR) protein